MGASAEMVETGEDKCTHESICWKPGVADRTACDALGNTLRSGSAPFDRASTWWDESFDGSNSAGGICRLGGMEAQGEGWSTEIDNGYKASSQWGANTMDAITKQKTICEGSEFGGTLYYARRFQEGRYDSETKCLAPYCNVADRWYANVITPEMCTEAKIGGRCNRWNCEGCQEDWETRQALPWEQQIHQMCYVLTSNATTCAQKQTAAPDKEWTFAGTYCWSKHLGRSECTDSFTRCEDLDKSACRDDYGDPVMKNISTALLCKATARTMCKTKSDCESSGDCHGGMRAEYCYSDSGGSHECKNFPFICVKPMGKPRDCDYCGHKDCSYLKKTANAYDWDDMIHDLWEEQKCIDIRNSTAFAPQATCEAHGGVWTSTFTNSTICESNTFCVDRSSGHHYREMDPTTCAQCDGIQQPTAHWEGSEWKIPAMVGSGGDGTMQWVNKAVEPLNKWTTVLNHDGLRDVVALFKEMLRSESEGAFTSCMYGAQSGALRAVATACDVSTATGRRTGTPQLDRAYLLARENVFVGNADRVGNSQQSNIQVQANTFSATTDVAIYESPFLPAGSSTVDTSNSVVMSTGTMYDSSCYSVVSNTNSVRVGQLVGNCVQVLAGNAFVSTATLCLAVSANIMVASQFTVKDFAMRTGSSTDDYLYRPAAVSVTETSGTFCATVSANGWYCPIQRTSGYASASADTGSLQCPALDSLVAQAQLSQDCAAGDQNACDTMNSVNNVTSTSRSVTYSFAPASPTPAPTASGAPPPPPKQIQQVVTLSHLSLATFNEPAVKLVYEVAYGLTLGIYNSATLAYHTGCTVSSSAVAARRAGVSVTYSAIVSHERSATAESAAVTLASNPAAFVSNVAAAKTHVQASTGMDTSAIVAPTASQVSAQAPTVTTVNTSESSGDSFPLIAVIIGCVAGALVLALCACGVFYYTSGSSQPAEPTKNDGKAEVEMTHPPIGVTPRLEEARACGPETCFPDKTVVHQTTHVDPADQA